LTKFYCIRREQADEIAQEDKYRRTFAENPSDPSIQDPHLTLINVFDNVHGFDYAEETSDEVRFLFAFFLAFLRGKKLATFGMHSNSLHHPPFAHDIFAS
jgi:hypothetical protein